MSATNTSLINKAADVAIAAMSSSKVIFSKEGGDDVAAFIEAVYLKLVELNHNSNP